MPLPTSKQIEAMFSYATKHVKTTTTVRDRGADRAIKEIAKAKKEPFVKVGFLEEGEPRKDSGPTNAQIAFWNEFGTSRIPERPFMRLTWIRKRRDIAKVIDKTIGEIQVGRMTVAEALGIIGLKAQQATKRTIVTLRDPPNAPSTIMRKKSSNPLIDTSQMLNSVQYKVSENGEE